MTICKSHLDGWGNPILPYHFMLKYYARDKTSQKIVRERLPKSFVVLPTVEIRFHPKNPTDVVVILLYPGGNSVIRHFLSERAVNGLRTAYKGRGGWYGEKRPFGWISIQRKGKVIPKPEGGNHTEFPQ